MKTMTCKQLGGACDLAFHANSFDEMANLSRQHCMEMFQHGDAAHIQAMEEMMKQYKSPEEMNVWVEAKRKEFNELPDNG